MKSSLIMQKSKLIYGIFITIVAYFFFAIGAAFVKAIGNTCAVSQILFIQNVICLIILLPYGIKTNHLKFKTPHLKLHLLRDFAGLLSYGAYYLAIKYLDLVDATVLSYTSPFYIPLILRLWKQEKIHSAVWWSITLGFLGIIMILNPSMQFVLIGAFVALFSGVCSSFALIAIRMLNQKGESLSTTLFYFSFISTLATLPFFLYENNYFFPLTTWCYMIGVGLSIAVGQIFLTMAYRHGSAAFLSPLSYFIVIFSSLISIVAFNDIPHWSAFIGMAIIIFGGSMSFIVSHKKQNFLNALKAPNTPWWKKLFYH